MDILTVLKKLGELEKALESAYAWTAEQCAADEAAAALFRRIAEEEGQHLELIRYQERVVRKSPKEFGGVEIDLPAVDRTLAKIDAFRTGTPSVRDAIRFALDIETEVSEHYAGSIMQQSNPNFAEIVKGLAANASQDHYRQLLEFAKDYPA